MPISKKKFRVWYTLKDGSSLQTVVPAKNKDDAWQEVKGTWYGYNPQMKQIKIER